MFKIVLLSLIVSQIPAKPGYYYDGGSYSSGGYAVYQKCIEVPTQVTKRYCKTVWEEACTTETKTFTVITGYRDDECRERCWRKKRSPDSSCVLKTFCTKVPIKERQSEDYNVCKKFPEELCEDRVVLEYVRDCSGGGSSSSGGGGKKEAKRERKAEKKEAKADRKAEKRARKAAKKAAKRARKGLLTLNDADYEYHDDDSELLSEDLIEDIQQLVSEKIQQENPVLSVRVL